MAVVGVQWDAANWPKCGKHGAAKADIEYVLLNDPRVAPDLKHSAVEDRFIAVGRDRSGRPMFVGFTYRMAADKLYIRPVTARYMHRKEAERYGAQSAQDEDG